MAVAATLFVSNRLQRMTAAFLCLMAMQLSLASCGHTELVPGFAPGAAIVSIDR
jgi:hypothetical protein